MVQDNGMFQDELSLEDALGPDPSSADKLKSDGKTSQPGWPTPQPGSWPGQPGPGQPGPGQPGPGPGQPGPWPGQPGPWPAQPGSWPAQPGPWPGQPGPWPGQPGPWPGQPGQPGTWPGQPGPWPGQSGPWPGQPGPYAPPMPASFGSPGVPNQPGQGSAALSLPYDLATPGGWAPQKIIKILGTVKMNIDHFVIDVHCDQDIAFHLSVRFREDGHHQVLVRNSKINNAWGGEERVAPRFPFKQGESFEILILGEPNQYRVAVNNQHLLEFKHRFKTLQDVTRVSVRGDIILHAMFMQ
ncbi:galectin-3b isoform X3 [Cetorhinus maximus]